MSGHPGHIIVAGNDPEPTAVLYNDAACLKGDLMNFRRAGLSILSVSLMALTLFCRPAYAEQGELIAQDAKAQINVRSLANTEADIVAAGAVGDQVEILEHSVGNDALIWYQVKLTKSGKTGWIRGDLIKILGSPSAKAAKPAASKKQSTVKAKAEPAKGSAPVTLAPPKPPASAKSAAPKKPATPTNSSAATAKSASSSEHSSGKPSTDRSDAEVSSATITTFETPTYTVRVFSRSGQLRLNLYNRKAQAIALSAVPIQSKSTSDGTTYSYQGEVKVTVMVPTSGQPTVSTSALGENLTERPESPPVPKASTEAMPAPTPAPSPEVPAGTAPSASPAPSP